MFEQEENKIELSEFQREILAAAGLESLEDLENALQGIEEELQNPNSTFDKGELQSQKEYFEALKAQVHEN